MRNHRLGVLSRRRPHPGPGHRGHDRHPHPTRPRRRRRLARRARRDRPPPPGRHRPRRRRAADDRPAGRAGPRAQLQRRGLQPPRAAGRTARPRTCLPYAQRHRGGAARVRRVGRGRRRPSGGHVRFRRLGRARASGCCWSATGSASSRCSGRPSTAGWPSPPSPRHCSPTRRYGPAWTPTDCGRRTACCSTPGRRCGPGCGRSSPVACSSWTRRASASAATGSWRPTSTHRRPGNDRGADP